MYYFNGDDYEFYMPFIDSHNDNNTGHTLI